MLGPTYLAAGGAQLHARGQLRCEVRRGPTLSAAVHQLLPRCWRDCSRTAFRDRRLLGLQDPERLRGITQRAYRLLRGLMLHGPLADLTCECLPHTLLLSADGPCRHERWCGVGVAG